MMIATLAFISCLLIHSYCCLTSCLHCDSSGTICLACKDPELVPMVDGGCYVPPSHIISDCGIYSEDGRCSKCQPTYSFRHNNTLCEKTHEGCVAFDHDNHCTECSFGLTLKNQECIGIIDCARYSKVNPNLCELCANGNLFNQTSCITADGCENIFSKGICKQCKKGYYLSGFSCIKNQVVKPIGCSIVDTHGRCLFCNSGAAPISGVCIRGDLDLKNLRYNYQQKQLVSSGEKPLPPNCLHIDNSNGACIKCSENYFLRGSDCIAVSPLCDGYNILNGECLACVSGYTKGANGNCLPQSSSQPQPQPTQQAPTQIPFCAQASPTGSCITCQSPYLQASDGFCYDQRCYSGNRGNCASCQPGFYVSDRTCIAIPIQGCSNFTSGQCVACNQGLSLINGNCVAANQVSTQPQVLPISQPQQPQQQSDPNCRQLGPSGQCITCFQSYVLGSNGRCVLANQQCATIDSSGRCSSCYSGYSLQNGNCVASVGDPNCRSYSQLGSCVQCATSYFISNGVCTLSSSLCASTDRNGVCLSCYPGYSLRNGNCSVFIQDPNCKQYSDSGCSLCSSGFYMSEGKCVLISPLCSTANNVTGRCLSCYPGYELNSNGQCVVAARAGNCARTENNVCISCVSGSYLRQGICYQVSPLCGTFDPMSGFCLSCYQGYQLSGGNCVVSMNTSNCKTSQNGGCVECFQGFNLLSNRNCVAANPLCRTSNPATGACSSCYQGYTLINDNCSLPTNSDPNCIQKAGVFCLTCTNGYYILSGSCTRVTKSCATYEMATGNCISCAADLGLLNGDCVPAAQRSDINCLQVGPSGNCVSCNPGYFINTSYPSSSCQLVSQLCFVFNYQTLQCTQCQNGYFLQDGGCIYPSMGYDRYCERYSGSYCERCSTGYYLSSYICTQMDPNCVSFNPVSGTCLQCRSGNPQGATCV